MNRKSVNKIINDINSYHIYYQQKKSEGEDCDWKTDKFQDGFYECISKAHCQSHINGSFETVNSYAIDISGSEHNGSGNN